MNWGQERVGIGLLWRLVLGRRDCLVANDCLEKTVVVLLAVYNFLEFCDLWWLSGGCEKGIELGLLFF